MPFGLSNIPASFPGYINKILVNKFDNFIIIYPDNILIWTINFAQGYVQAFIWVLNFLRKYRFFCQFEKMSILKRQSLYSGLYFIG